MMYDVKQFILNSGEEVMCEVLEWVEDGHKEIVVKNAMCIALINSNRESYYSFKPWIHYIEGPSEFIVINTDHIVATANPNMLLLSQYEKAVHDMHMTHRQREIEYRQDTQEKLKRAGEAIHTLMTEKVNPSDSDKPDNIIRFPF